MTDTNERLNFGSATLQKRLYEITSNLLNIENEYQSVYYPNHAIVDLSAAVLQEGDYETVQDHLNYLLDKLESLLKNLTFYLKQYNFQTLQIQSGFEWPNNVIPHKELKSTINKRLKQELLYYIKSVKELHLLLEEKMEQLGINKFSNAGHKVKFNLTVEELGCLFYYFFESEMISNKTSTEKPLTKKLLAEFISKNFSCRTSKDIGRNSMENALSFKNPSAIGKIEQRFDKFSEFINSINRE